MKNRLILLLSLLAVSTALFAAPARKGLVPRTQPDGTTIMVRLHGDEFGHWLTDASGNLLAKDSDGFLRPVADGGIAIRQNGERASARRAAANRRRAQRAGSSANFGSPRIPVILVGFKDLAFTKTAEQFDAMLNQRGYTDNDAIGSVYDYFNENSFGKFTPQFDVLGPVRTNYTMAYYGENISSDEDRKPEMALVHALLALDDQVDFSVYDNDHDGNVEFVIFYFAGYDEAQWGPDDAIWSHAWTLQASSEARDSSTYDGVKFCDYFCTAELYGNKGSTMCHIGTTCHEFSHTLGLPDFYDADYNRNGNAANTYDFDLMSNGSYNSEGTVPPYLNAEEVWEVGWLDEIPLLPGKGSYDLPAVNHSGAESYYAYQVNTTNSGEYFILETRSGPRWDKPLPSGMLAYHVDRSNTRVGNTTAIRSWDSNTVNNYSSHPCCYIIQPSNQSSTAEYSQSSMKPLVFPGSSGVTALDLYGWDGLANDLCLKDISYSGGSTSFVVKSTNSMEATGYGYILNPGNGVYQSGDSFELVFVAGDGNRVPDGNISWYFDDEPVSVSEITLTAGTHTVEAMFTTKEGKRKSVSLTLKVN